ncbi:MAG: hypothetical protein ACRC7N_05105 [Clostridium sp.]
MSGRGVKGIITSSVLLTMLLFVGCGKDEIREESIKKPELNNGAIITEINDELKNYNMINNKYVLLEEYKGITHYNKESKNYIYYENGKYFASNGKEQVEVTGDTISNLELSPNGKYVSYFSLDEGYKFIVKNIEKNHQENIKSNVSISGDLIKWLNGNEVVYYGADDNGKTAIYKYNFNDEKETELYEIKGAFIERLVAFNNSVYCIVNNFEDNKIIKKIDDKGKTEDIFTSENKIISYFEKVNDELYFIAKESDTSQTLYSIVDSKVTKIISGISEFKQITKINDKYIVLGKFVGNEESLYMIENEITTRLVYGFPAAIGYNRTMECGVDGKVLFVGKATRDDGEESIYSVDGSKTVTSIFIGKGSIEFVKIN